MEVNHSEAETGRTNREKSALSGELARDYGCGDYDIRHNLTAQYVLRAADQGAESLFGVTRRPAGKFQERCSGTAVRRFRY
jgi:hypothetical protein